MRDASQTISAGGLLSQERTGAAYARCVDNPGSRNQTGGALGAVSLGNGEQLEFA